MSAKETLGTGCCMRRVYLLEGRGQACDCVHETLARVLAKGLAMRVELRRVEPLADHRAAPLSYSKRDFASGCRFGGSATIPHDRSENCLSLV